MQTPRKPSSERWPLPVRYADAPKKLVESVESNAALTQTDETVLALSVAFCSVLGLLVTGQRFDEKISDTLVQKGGG